MTKKREIDATVIVPSYRGVNRLPQLLDSLAVQQDGTPSFEVIVVVDGVDDGSVALLKNESRLDLRSIVFPENRGRVAALNAGFEAARGDVLIRCDDDLVVPSGYVAAHFDAHASGDPVGVVGPTRDIHAPSAYARAYGEDAARKSYAHVLSRPPAERWRLWAASCSITKSTWESIGAYDDRYKAYGWEDVDYGYRLHSAGLPIEVVDAATAQHLGPAPTARARSIKAFEAGGARATFRRLHPEAPIGAPSAGTGLWGAAVRLAASCMRSRRAVERRAGRVDRLLPLVPRPIGRKLVALAVEGAGLAGAVRSTDEGGTPR